MAREYREEELRTTPARRRNDSARRPEPEPFDPQRHRAYDPRDLAALRSSGLFREDQDSLFTATALNFVKTQVYERLLPAINANLLVPDITGSAPEWIETMTVRAYSDVGMAKVISNYADDLPRADVAGAMLMVTVKTIGDSYGYSVNELRASRALGTGLDSRKAEAARRAIELKIADIKLRGDPAYALYGLFTHPNIPEVILSFGGPWSALTGDQIYANLVEMYGAYEMQSMGVHRADFLALAPAAFFAASTKFVTGAPGMPVTALGLFEAMHEDIQVVNVWECAGADPLTSSDVALLYENSSANLAHELVMPFTQLPPEARNLEIVTDCLARSGGTQVYYPLALLRAITS